jgi:hypothetical protein
LSPPTRVKIFDAEEASVMEIQSIKPRDHTPDSPSGRSLRVAIVVGSVVALTAAVVLVLL